MESYGHYDNDNYTKARLEMTVVNFATGNYIKGQDRLRESLKDSGVRFLGFTNYREIDSPTHQESPYEFKVHCIRKALKQDSIVIYADSSVWLHGNIQNVKAIIETEGYYFEEAGHYVRDWCKDATLKYFGINRQSDYKMFIAGLIGLNLHNHIAMQWLDEWEQSAKDGHFRGDWKDHRHDMTCGSIIAEQLGMKYHSGGSHIAYIGKGYSEPQKDVVFYCQGM